MPTSLNNKPMDEMKDKTGSSALDHGPVNGRKPFVKAMLTVCLGAMVMALCFAGCGSEDTAAASTGTTPAAEVTAAVEQTAQPEPTATPAPAETAETAETAAVPESANQESTEAPAGSALASASVGDVVTYGTYEQDNDEANGAEEIEWLVLDKTDDSILLLSRYALDVQHYNDYQVATCWKDCTLRQWLNNDFYETAFNEAEQGSILMTEVKNSGTDQDTEDSLFLLSIAEVKGYFPTRSDRLCEATPYAVSRGAFVNTQNGCSLWWLRNNGESSTTAAYVITRDGSCDATGDNVKRGNYCVRPAMWVSLAD